MRQLEKEDRSQGAVMEVRERVALKRLRISRPNNGTGQTSMTRTEREKNCPARMQESGRVLGGKKEVPSTPVTEIGDETVGRSVNRM